MFCHNKSKDIKASETLISPVACGVTSAPAVKQALLEVFISIVI